MPRPGPPLRGTKYEPVLAYLAAHDGETVTLTLARIEEMIGVALSNSARINPSIWQSGAGALGPRFRALGWRAHLDVKAHAVTFTRVPEGV